MSDSLQRWLRAQAHTLRVAGSYLLVIMIMSVGFSAVFYHTSAGELNRQLPPDSWFEGVPPDNDFGSYHAFFRSRISEGRLELLHRLILLNIAVLVLGALLSYYLARRSLAPIERALEAQKRFASDASHELRTPLAAMQAEGEVALRDPKLTLGRAKAVLQSHLEEVTRLQALTEALLKLAREDNPVNPIPVTLPYVVSEALNGCLKAAQSKDIVIDDRTPKIQVMADPAGLTQALSVLLDNAIKYSEAGSTIHLTAGQSGREGWLQVQDEGVGIGAQDLPHIFERFYRADSSRSKQNVEGHGLGLSLAAKLINQLNGEITASSRPGQGSIFTIKLPLA